MRLKEIRASPSQSAHLSNGVVCAELVSHDCRSGLSSGGWASILEGCGLHTPYSGLDCVGEFNMQYAAPTSNWRVHVGVICRHMVKGNVKFDVEMLVLVGASA